MRKYKYEWNLTNGRRADGSDISAIAADLGVTPVTAELLANRGCTGSDAADAFIAKKEALLHDPFLMKDMEPAARRILDAVSSGEKIIVYGDYDVDGVTSVSALLLYLRSISANADYYIPNRIGEGYGMSESAVRSFSSDGVSLVITVDTGITAVAEAALCRDLGMTLIVTDHHECHSELPDAYAVVNPHRPDCEYPFKELAGVGVVFKLLCALEKLHSGDDMYAAAKRVAERYIDLVAIGTVADVMPLKDENRLIVSVGLARIEHSDRPGLVALMDAVAGESKKQSAARKITSGYISFSIAPRINAAGRISSAGIAVSLFLEQDRIKADRLAQKLCEINRERQHEENVIADSASAKIEADAELRTAPVIVLDDDSWHHGIIGIVASRITEKYARPSILISFEGSVDGEPSGDDIGKGSGRSVKGMNLVEALHSCSDLLEKYGGHELAAGLSVKRENLPALRERLSAFAEQSLGTEPHPPTVDYEMLITKDDVTMRQASELYLLEPFGVANPMPVFRMNSVPVTDLGTVGAGKHTKFTLKCGSEYVSAMCFRHIPEDYDVYPGDEVDVLFTLDINEFQGHKSLQFIVKDLRLTQSAYLRECTESDKFAEIIDCYERGAAIPLELVRGNIPTRDDFASVYSLLRNELRMDHEIFSIRALTNLMRSSGVSVGYVKLRIAILVLDEMQLIGAECIDPVLEAYRFTYIRTTEKRNLENSRLIQALRAADA